MWLLVAQTMASELVLGGGGGGGGRVQDYFNFLINHALLFSGMSLFRLYLEAIFKCETFPLFAAARRVKKKKKKTAELYAASAAASRPDFSRA